MRMRIVIGVVTWWILAASAAPAQAQFMRYLGVGIAAAGTAMLVIDPKQPVQPTQPGIVSSRTLMTEYGILMRSREFSDLIVDRDTRIYYFRNVADSWQTGLRNYWNGAWDGAVVGGAGMLALATDEGRTIYEGEFKPFIPFRERTPAMRYGGAALVIGGAFLAALWPDRPALDDVSFSATADGGVRAAKTFAW